MQVGNILDLVAAGDISKATLGFFIPMLIAP
jgi:hypothetical protein